MRYPSGSSGISPYERVMSRITKESNGCWLFLGAVDGGGYGMVKVGGRAGRIEKAHRIVYRQHFGPIPDGKEVIHHCNTKRCVNPDHLDAGTHSENMQGAYDTGLIVQRRHTQALSDGNVAQIKAMLGMHSRRYIAQLFGVSHATINKIANGERYKDIT